jgi:hypothetical protein
MGLGRAYGGADAAFPTQPRSDGMPQRSRTRDRFRGQKSLAFGDATCP